MEHLEGESLQERLEQGPLPMDQVLSMGVQIADALDKAHRNGVVHRDLKPGNIMLTPSGAAKLVDFGIARANSNIGVTETGTSGTKLQVDLPLGSMGCQVSGCPSSGNSSTQISYLQPSYDGGPCSGDSGGPAFIDRGGVTYLAGLTSYGDAACTVYGVSTHTAPFETWITDFADPTVDTGTSDSGEPGTCELAAVGESCSVNADCCSDNCKGKKGAKTCK